MPQPVPSTQMPAHTTISGFPNPDKVIIRLWPGGYGSLGKKYISLGHVALEIQSEKNDIHQYISFWPGNCTINNASRTAHYCQQQVAHYHTRDTDDLEMDTVPIEISLLGLDAAKINQAYLTFQATGNFHVLASSWWLNDPNTKNCIGLVLHLLISGGLNPQQQQYRWGFFVAGLLLCTLGVHLAAINDYPYRKAGFWLGVLGMLMTRYAGFPGSTIIPALEVLLTQLFTELGGFSHVLNSIGMIMAPQKKPRPLLYFQLQAFILSASYATIHNFFPSLRHTFITPHDIINYIKRSKTQIEYFRTETGERRSHKYASAWVMQLPQDRYDLLALSISILILSLPADVFPTWLAKLITTSISIPLLPAHTTIDYLSTNLSNMIWA